MSFILCEKISKLHKTAALSDKVKSTHVVGDRRHNLEVADHHIALAVASGKLAVVVVRHTDQQQRIVVAAAAVGGCCRRCCMGAAAVAAG